MKGNIMKKYIPHTAGATLGALFCAAAITVNAGGVQTAIGSDVSREELRAITVESFDRDYSGGGYGWEAHTNKDTKTRGPYNPVASNLQSEREVKLIKGTPSDIQENADYDQARVFGLKFAFTFPGNNVVSLRPPSVDHYTVERPRPYLNEIALMENYQARSCFENPALSATVSTQRAQMVDCVTGVELPGNVDSLSVWVMGRGNEYTMEAWLEDWKGFTHILKFGSLDFIGWRPLTVKVPDNIPQDVDSFPQTKNIILKQFKIRSMPKTSQETVYLFFDEVRVLTNLFEVHFDGASLDFDRADCERKNKVMKLIRKNARYPDNYKLRDCSGAPGPAKPLEDQGGNEGGGGAGG